MIKVLINVFFIICIIGMILGGIGMIIDTGYKYILIYTTFGVSNTLLYFFIGSVFYALVFYTFYKIDVKVRKMLVNQK
jgi:hypothetical protein